MGHDHRVPLTVTPLIAAHLRAIVPQLAQQGKLNPDVSRYVSRDSFTVWAGGEIILCGGVQPIWPGRGYAWSILTERAGLHFIRLHRLVRGHLDGLSLKRIEANVDVGFAQGHRWIMALGFEVEGYLRAFNPDGSDSVLYARIR